MSHLRYTLGVCSVSMGMFCLTFPLQAEMYIAGQMGVNIPRNLSNVELLMRPLKCARIAFLARGISAGKQRIFKSRLRTI